jgi:hypothetical protein
VHQPPIRRENERMIKKAQQQQRNRRRAPSQKVSLLPANERKTKNDLQNSVCMKNENTTAPLFVHFD